MAVGPDRFTGKRLDSWKEIAAFFGRAERTVKRWEAARGLPVHRLPGNGRRRRRRKKKKKTLIRNGTRK